jgi:uncharacterized membrane protein
LPRCKVWPITSARCFPSEPDHLVSFVEYLDAAHLWRAVSLLGLAWLAFFFGRTLRAGYTPLIEQFARVGTPDLSPALCIYMRRLTGIWCLYFVLAAVASLWSGKSVISTGALIWIGTIVLFVGEHRLRPKFFPGQKFPGLLQQGRDTWHVWHKKT